MRCKQVPGLDSVVRKASYEIYIVKIIQILPFPHVCVEAPLSHSLASCS